MRKTLLIISLVAAMAVSANAQTENARFGIKLGPTFDWASSGSTAASNDGFRLGASLGLVYDYYVTSNVAVSSGVGLNYLRLKYTFTDYRRVEDFLEEANVPVSRRLNATNIEIVDYMTAAKNLQFSADCEAVYNPSAASVWLVLNDKVRAEIPGGQYVDLSALIK